MIAAFNVDCIRVAAFDLMVESLHDFDITRQIENVLLRGEDPDAIAKIIPQRKVADGYYSVATYLMWLRGMLASGVELAILADEAEGLRSIEAARQEFEKAHPACPRCGTRQYSKSPISCRSCAMDFRKGQ